LIFRGIGIVLLTLLLYYIHVILATYLLPTCPKGLWWVRLYHSARVLLDIKKYTSFVLDCKGCA
jgi:hypothetical protein